MRGRGCIKNGNTNFTQIPEELKGKRSPSSDMNSSGLSAANASSNDLEDLYFPLDVPYTAAEIVIAAIAALGNFLVCIAVSQDRKLWTVTNYFLVSLSVADTLVGTFAIPCAILTSIGVPQHKLRLCLLMLSILIMLTMTSTFSLLAVAVDRYIAILHPLRYKSIMTHSNSLVMIVVAWISSFLGGLMPVMGWYKATSPTGHCLFTQVVDMTYIVYFFAFTFFLLPLVVMFVIYAKIYMEVRKQLRVMAKGTQPGNAGGKNEVSLKKEMKTATSLFTIIFFFVLCWAPLHIINCVILFCPDCFIPLLILQISIVLTHANSAVNPILYAYKLKTFRNAFKAIFMCRRDGVTPGKHLEPDHSGFH
uniref:G-protein coupled receptors family 1 profile domain-containing protein n=1 Tax=Leptobrachium leishanense TaxID=445787 RepID=A0A8C5PMF7_9ANUR